MFAYATWHCLQWLATKRKEKSNTSFNSPQHHDGKKRKNKDFQQLQVSHIQGQNVKEKKSKTYTAARIGTLYDVPSSFLIVHIPAQSPQLSQEVSESTVPRQRNGVGHTRQRRSTGWRRRRRRETRRPTRDRSPYFLLGFFFASHGKCTTKVMLDLLCLPSPSPPTLKAAASLARVSGLPPPSPPRRRSCPGCRRLLLARPGWRGLQSNQRCVEEEEEKKTEGAGGRGDELLYNDIWWLSLARVDVSSARKPAQCTP